MKIANPIYDVFFKYLMEDIDIAKGLLSKIIGEEILALELKPQEQSTRSTKFQIIIFRLDFKALIQTKTGKPKKILIELQKGKLPEDILRFRRYLGENYQKEDVHNLAGTEQKAVLPIITIYFLGFKLHNIKTSVLKVNRRYHDLIHQKVIETKEDFIEQLTHDSYVIQIRRLPPKSQTELERILQVFNQLYMTDDRKILELPKEALKDDELLQMMVNRLSKAVMNEEVYVKAILEEEVESKIEKHIRSAQKAREAEEKAKAAAQKAREAAQKAREENEHLKLELERLKKLLDNNQGS